MQQKLVKILLSAFVIYFTYYIFSTSIHVRFWADDFCTGAIFNQYGFWGSQRFNWLTWSGRYSYMFFLYFFIMFGSSITKFVPIILFIFLVLSVWAFVYKLVIPKSKLFSLVLSATFIIIVLMNNSNIIQSFYWYGGTLIYTLPFVFFYMFMSLVVWRNFKLFKNNPKLLYFASFITMFIAGGFNEVFTVSQIIFLSFFLISVFILNVKEKEKVKRMLLVGIMGLNLSLALMYFSPGATIRATTVSKASNIFWVMERSYAELVVFMNSFLNSKVFFYTVALIFSLTFIIVDMWKKTLKIRLGFGKTIFFLILTIFSALVSIISIYATAYYSMSYHPPERALINATFIIIMSLVLSGILVSSYLVPRLSKYKIISFTVFLIFLTTLLLLARDAKRNWRFLRNDLKTYADAWDIQQESIASQVISGDKVLIKYVPPVGRIDGFKDNKGWVTGCSAGYYGVREFVVE